MKESYNDQQDNLKQPRQNGIPQKWISVISMMID